MFSSKITERLFEEAAKPKDSPFKRGPDGSLVMMFDSIRVRLDGDRVTTVLLYRGEAIHETTVPNFGPGVIANFVGISGQIGVSVEI